jgi:hypothetical protein
MKVIFNELTYRYLDASETKTSQPPPRLSSQTALLSPRPKRETEKALGYHQKPVGKRR